MLPIRLHHHSVFLQIALAAGPLAADTCSAGRRSSPGAVVRRRSRLVEDSLAVKLHSSLHSGPEVDRPGEDSMARRRSVLVVGIEEGHPSEKECQSICKRPRIRGELLTGLGAIVALDKFTCACEVVDEVSFFRSHRK